MHGRNTRAEIKFFSEGKVIKRFSFHMESLSERKDNFFSIHDALSSVAGKKEVKF